MRRSGRWLAENGLRALWSTISTGVARWEDSASAVVDWCSDRAKGTCAREGQPQKNLAGVARAMILRSAPWMPRAVPSVRSVIELLEARLRESAGKAPLAPQLSLGTLSPSVQAPARSGRRRGRRPPKAHERPQCPELVLGCGAPVSSGRRVAQTKGLHTHAPTASTTKLSLPVARAGEIEAASSAEILPPTCMPARRSR